MKFVRGLVSTLVVLLLFAVGAIAGYLYGRTDSGSLFVDRLGVNSLWVFGLTLGLALFVSIWIVALLHELGHVWGGTLSGEELMRVHVWPLALTRKGDGFTLGFVNIFRPFGSTISLPVSGDNLRRATFLKILAGPLASFALFVVLGLGSYGLWLRTDPANGTAVAWKLLLGGAALVALVEFVANLVPHKTDQYANDGYQLLGLMRNDPPLIAGLHIALLWGRLIQRERPRDHEPAIVIGAVERAADPMQKAVANWLAFYWALDRGDIEGAAGYLQRSMELDESKIVAAIPDLLLDAAYFEARYRSNPALARSLVAKTDGRKTQPAMRLRADTAILFAEGDLRGALDKANEGMKLIKSLPQTGGKIAEIEWLEEISREAQAVLDAEID